MWRGRAAGLLLALFFGNLRSAPDPPARNAKRDVSQDGRCGLNRDQPFQAGRIVEKMPGTGAHRADQYGQHSPGERSPGGLLGHISINPNQPDGGDPFHHARDVDDPGRD